MSGAVGPIGLPEHLFWFAVLSLFVFLVYHGLRTESVRVAFVTGLRRWAVFLGGCAVLAVVSGLLAEVL